MDAELMINKSRLRWLDALKGFAILTVVYLHVHNGYEYEGTFDGEIVKWITSYYNKFGQESRAASPAFFPSRA